MSSRKEVEAWTPGFQSLRSRYAMLASFYIAIVLAIPIWLKTTTIERLPLPRHEVVAWESRLPCPIRTPHFLTVYFPPGIIPSAEEHLVSEELHRGLKAAGDGIVEEEQKRNDECNSDEGDCEAVLEKAEESLLQESKPLEHAACIDWDVRVKSSTERRVVAGLRKFQEDSIQGGCKRFANTLYLCLSVDYEVEFVIGNQTLDTLSSTSTGRKFQLPLPTILRPPHEHESQQISHLLASYMARLFQLPYASLFYPSLSSTPTLQKSQGDSESMKTAQSKLEQILEDRRRIPYTRNLRLVYSLINEDISASSSDPERGREGLSGVKGWNEAEVDSLFLERFNPLFKALAGTQRFYKELQTTWFAPLQFHPKVLEVERASSPGTTTDAVDPDPIEETMAKVDDVQDEEEKMVDDLDELRIAEEEIDPATGISIDDETKVETMMDRVHLIDWEALKIFVNPGEWSLTSGAITSPLSFINTSSIHGAREDMSELFEQTERTLQFVLYVPKPSHRPLRIAGDEEATTISSAKGWLIPQWGGVSLFNLGYEDESTSTSMVKSTQSGSLASLSAAEMDNAFATFEKQFNTLLGLQELDVTDVKEDAGLALKIDAMTRRRIMAASRESVKTLGSIIRLVDKIKVLGVGQSVQDDVSRALVLLQEASRLMNTTSYDTHTTLTDVVTLFPLQTLLDLVHSSELLSSRAFFNPNMLGQLYFPDEHKYAVYTPLFGPLAVPLLVAGIRLVKERRKGKREEEEKKKTKSKAQ